MGQSSMADGAGRVRWLIGEHLAEVERDLRHSWRGVPNDVVEDAVQDAVVVVLGMRDPPCEPKRLRAFLRVVGRRNAADAMERRRRRKAVGEGEGDPDDIGGDPATALNHVLAREIVAEIRASPLTFRTRGVLERVFTGETTTEIAIALGIKRANVRQKLSRGRAWLLARLGLGPRAI